MKIIIKNIKNYGTIGSDGIHQILNDEADIENALHDAERNEFNRIFFYVTYHEGWMTNADFRWLISSALSHDTHKAVLEFVRNERIDVHTISLYSGNDEAFFGQCDITGADGMVGECSALDMDGLPIHFAALDDLIGGALGKLARAF